MSGPKGPTPSTKHVKCSRSWSDPPGVRHAENAWTGRYSGPPPTSRFQHHYNPRAPAGNRRQRRSLTGKSQLLSVAEALSRLIPNADDRLILVIRHRQVANEGF